MASSYDDLKRFFAGAGAVVRVTLTGVRGSAPREAGTEMFVSEQAIHGTIGGGQLEYAAIDKARALLAGDDDTRHLDVPLGPEIGQCCGGRVEIDITRMSKDDQRAALQEADEQRGDRPHVYIFGSGHTGRALADAFALLPVKTILIDSREGELSQAAAPVEKRLAAIPEAIVREAPAGSAFIVLTHEHALDFLIAAEALRRGDAAYVGMIGSRSKRASFEKWCRRPARADIDTSQLISPIGAGFSRDKRPQVIAAFVAAEVIFVLTHDADRATTPATETAT